MLAMPGQGLTSSTKNQGKNSIIEFYSKTWSKSEINYEILHKEMAAIMYCLRFWRHRILGKTCTLFTDCKALVEWKNIRNPQGRLAKFCLFLTHFGENLTLKYIKGKRNIVADYLSRSDLNAAPKEDLSPSSNIDQAFEDTICSINTEKDLPKSNLPRIQGKIYDFSDLHPFDILHDDDLINHTSFLKSLQESDPSLHSLISRATPAKSFEIVN